MGTKKYFYTYHWVLALSAWFLFSIFYWISATLKPFAPGSYLSWVYASRCSYSQILALYDTGIGHPPLFHLLQKLVQDILPGYHFLHVRLVNYIIGSGFIILLSKYLSKFKRNIFFILSISISATILNAFVYARMWGGVALLSLIVIIMGESYIDTKKKKYLFFMALAFMLGLFFDYNFILMAPYSFLVIVTHYENRRKLYFLGILSLFLIWVVAFGISVNKFGFSLSIYKNLINIYILGFNLYNLMFYLWYVEIIILTMIFLLGILFIQYRKKAFTGFYAFLGFLLFIAFVFLFINEGYLRVRYTSILLLLPSLFYFGIKNKLIHNSFNNRLLFSITFGSIIILIISPIFWVDLVDSRFIIIFLPVFIILFYKNFNGRILNIIAMLLMISGINFTLSSYLNDRFWPNDIPTKELTIFQSPAIYGSQYLKNDIFSKKQGQFLPSSFFENNCRVCSMGLDQIDYSQLDSLNFVSSNQLPIKLLLKRFKIKKEEIFGLTELDKIQLKYLTPLYKNYSIVYEMVKKNEEVK